MRISFSELYLEYMRLPAIGFKYFYLSFQNLIIVFAMATGIILYLRRKSSDRSILALVATTWISALGSIFWILAIKGHSASHWFIDTIVWSLPFSILGFSLVAIAVKEAWNYAKGENDSKLR